MRSDRRQRHSPLLRGVDVRAWKRGQGMATRGGGSAAPSPPRPNRKSATTRRPECRRALHDYFAGTAQRHGGSARGRLGSWAIARRRGGGEVPAHRTRYSDSNADPGSKRPSQPFPSRNDCPTCPASPSAEARLARSPVEIPALGPRGGHGVSKARLATPPRDTP